MGEAVLGAFLPVLLEKLADQEITEYFGRLKGVDKKVLEKWTRALTAIEAVLSDAEEKQLTRRAVKEWLDDLRDLAYDVIDVLDIFDTKMLERRIERQQGSKSKLWSSLSQVKSNFGLNSAIKEISDRLEEITTRKKQFGLKELGVSKKPWKMPPTTYQLDGSVIGRDEAKDKILYDLLSKQENYHVVGIVGTGGLGKTTLAKHVFNDAATGQFSPKGWVSVSDDFDIVRVAAAVLESVTSAPVQEFKELNSILDKLSKELAGKKFLIVLDDVWHTCSYGQWTTLQASFRVGAAGSKIIVTTRDANVAKTMGDSSPYNLKPMSEDDCWELFQHHALLNNRPEDVEFLKEKIVEKCNGLPLAARTLGGLLHCKEVDEWKDILDHKLWTLSDSQIYRIHIRGVSMDFKKIGMKQIPKHVRCHKQTALERAKSTLLLASLPKSLPCRDKEMLEISAFIKGAISDDKCLGRCLYIHGVPGTGKTMSVLAVMRNLRSEVDAGSIRPYCFIEINGLKLASPENIYRAIYEALSGHRVGWKKALHLLNERFSNGKKFGKDDDKPCILLIDELDLLVTRNQSVLYNILDWPTKPNSKLVVIGIANTMDLPEKLLPRISSRMGIQRLCFGPYNYRQLQEIISSRLRGIDAFEKQAIEFASRKVAAISGDARRALEICRRAAEITDYRIKKLISTPKNASEGKALVGMAEVEAAIQEMFQAPHIQVMKTCSKLSKIYLTAMVYELYKTGMGETTFEKLAMTVYNLCTSNGEAFPGHDMLLKVGCKLGECRIILCESGAKHRLQKLQLNFPSDDVAFALKESKELPWLAKYL